MDSVLSGSKSSWTVWRKKHSLTVHTLTTLDRYQYPMDRLDRWNILWPVLPHPPDPALEPSFATDWTQWAGAIIGACLVGLTGGPLLQKLFFSTGFPGVLPLWVIPAKALGTAPSAPTEDNLKYLLAFAGVLPSICLFVESLHGSRLQLKFKPYFSSWRLTWWRFPSPPPWNISTCKESMATERCEVGCSKTNIFNTLILYFHLFRW